MISLIVPSRGRPEQLAEMFHTAYNTATDPDEVQLCVRLDEDDPSLPSYCDILKYDHRDDTLPRRVLTSIGPRVTMTQLWNEAYALATGDIIMHCADDIRFRTDDWDQFVTNVFNRFTDGVVFAHGRDGVHDANLGTHGFVSRTWVETVGYLLPPYFSSDYGDTWLNYVADHLGRRIFMAHVYTEHMHFVVGKGPLDLTHQERLRRHADDNVDQLWVSLQPERDADVEKLRAVMVQDL